MKGHHNHGNSYTRKHLTGACGGMQVGMKLVELRALLPDLQAAETETDRQKNIGPGLGF